MGQGPFTSPPDLLTHGSSITPPDQNWVRTSPPNLTGVRWLHPSPRRRTPGARRNASGIPQWRRTGSASVPRRQWSGVHQGDTFGRLTRTAKVPPWTSTAGAQHGGACLAGAVAFCAAGQSHALATRWGAWTTAVLAHTRPHHARSAQPYGIQRHVSKQRCGARVPCKQDTARQLVHRSVSSHGDGEHRDMVDPGASHRRGAACPRLEGQHTGRFTWQRVSTPPVHQRKRPRWREEKDGYEACRGRPRGSPDDQGKNPIFEK
jgi:hypothetical protein